MILCIALDPLYWFKSLAAHPAAIVDFKLDALSSSLAGEARFDGDNKMVK